MKTKSSLIAGVVLLLAGAAALTDTRQHPAAPAAASIKHAMPAHRSSPQIVIESPMEETSRDLEEAENLTAWRGRFDQLLKDEASRADAVQKLMVEMNLAYGKWVEGAIAPLALLPPNERYDPLAEIRESVAEGAVAILELLGVDGANHVTVLAGPLEVVDAEIQYAEAASEPAQRLALLRLDRERETRLEEMTATAGASSPGQSNSELDTWYDAELGKIFTSNEAE